MTFDHKIIDESLFIEYDNGQDEVIYVGLLKKWAETEHRLFVRRDIKEDGVTVDHDIIPITWDEYIQNITHREIEIFLDQRLCGIDS